jgi:arginyl-tRNA synthetase
VRFDDFVFESRLVAEGKIGRVLERLGKDGHTEERDGALWFLADRFGDEKPRVLKKRDGQNTYFATDVAYHLDKLERGFERLINIWGADHHGYIPRMRAAIAALGGRPEQLEVLLVQMVSLLRDGQPVVLSKRQGEIITLREVFEEVGADAARFFFLLRGPDSQMEFDIELAKKKSLDNPVFYAQYGHARLCSILRRAAEKGYRLPTPDVVVPELLGKLTLPEEVELARRLGEFGAVIKNAAAARAPHLLVYYLQELVGVFHGYYTRYARTQPVLAEDRQLAAARLVLVQAARQVLKNAFSLLGVSAPERMEALEEEA